MSRFARRVDDNQAAIVSALRQMGATVQSIAAVGAGAPDLLVGYRGTNWLLEVKDGAKVPSKQKLTPAEREWHDQWRGHVTIVRSVADALAVLRVTS